jgi:hypothetical protein
MSVIQIPNLPAAIALSGSEQLEAVQAGSSVRITVSQVKDYAIGIGSTVASLTVTGTLNAQGDVTLGSGFPAPTVKVTNTLTVGQDVTLARGLNITPSTSISVPTPATGFVVFCRSSDGALVARSSLGTVTVLANK